MDENGKNPKEMARPFGELVAAVETLIFVSDEPLPMRMLEGILQEKKEVLISAVEKLKADYEERGSGLRIREIGGGLQIATRTEFHEEIRELLRTRPSAKLSLASLETLSVIAYKQPVTIPEILEIRNVQSASSVKTLLDKRLIVSKGRKETVGKPMQYGTSKEFLIQFGLKNLSELPNVEDFEDFVQ